MLTRLSKVIVHVSTFSFTTNKQNKETKQKKSTALVWAPATNADEKALSSHQQSQETYHTPHTFQGKNNLDRNINLSRSRIGGKEPSWVPLCRGNTGAASESWPRRLFSPTAGRQRLAALRFRPSGQRSWHTRAMNTDLAGCSGPTRSACSPSGFSQSRRRRTHWSSTPPERPSPRQTGSPQTESPSRGPGQTRRATAEQKHVGHD